MKIKKKNQKIIVFFVFFLGGGSGWGVGGWGGQDRCEQRSEVFVNINMGGGGGCERRIEVFGKIHKKKTSSPKGNDHSPEKKHF